MFQKIEVSINHELGNTEERVSNLMDNLIYDYALLTYGANTEMAFTLTDCVYVDDRKCLQFSLSPKTHGDNINADQLQETELLELTLFVDFTPSLDILWAFGDVTVIDDTGKEAIQDVTKTINGHKWKASDAEKVIEALTKNGFYIKGSTEYKVGVRNAHGVRVEVTYSQTENHPSAVCFSSLVGSITRYLNIDLRGDHIHNICGLNRLEMINLIRQ
ncbi:hypothetical protein F7U66_10960 [Vibrio parahaemolyticus]|nr:hypothetical protein [Vibrio parahaemolyticus]